MVYSYTTTAQDLDTLQNVEFNIDVVKTGSTVIHSPGTATFVLSKPGFYYVTANLVGSASAAATDPVTVQFYNGATPIPGSVASELSSETTDIINLTSDLIIQVRPSCCAVDNTVNLVLVNTGVPATYTNATITITKIA